jgi:transcriptional regulator with XRE-family HTH domain
VFDHDTEELMDRLAELRERRGLTLRELSKMSGVSPDTINQIELGHRKARPSTLRKLARALEVDIKDFFEDEELTARPKEQALLSEDQVEHSRETTEGRRKAHGQFYDNAKKLSDGQLRQLRDSLIEDLSKGQPEKRLDRLDLWKDPRAQYEEVASRIWTINAMLQVRAGTASERDKEDLADLTG